MKVKTLSALAGLGGALILSGAANAAFTGLSWTGTPGVIVNGALGGTPPAWVGDAVITYEVYADFSNPLDALTAVYGNGTGPGFTTLSLTNDVAVVGDQAGTGFFNNSFGTDEAPNAALAVAEPSILFDSHVTIGAQAQPDETSFSPGFPSGLVNGNGVTGQTNVSWFTAGPMVQGTGVHILIGQWTVHAGEHLSGNVGIQYRPAGGAADLQVNNNFFTTIPAPGALALLGVAGLVGSRRRRA